MPPFPPKIYLVGFPSGLGRATVKACGINRDPEIQELGITRTEAWKIKAASCVRVLVKHCGGFGVESFIKGELNAVIILRFKQRIIIDSTLSLTHI